MCRKLTFLISVVLVLALAGMASAAGTICPDSIIDGETVTVDTGETWTADCSSCGGGLCRMYIGDESHDNGTGHLVVNGGTVNIHGGTNFDDGRFCVEYNSDITLNDGVINVDAPGGGWYFPDATGVGTPPEIRVNGGIMTINDERSAFVAEGKCERDGYIYVGCGTFRSRTDLNDWCGGTHLLAADGYEPLNYLGVDGEGYHVWTGNCLDSDDDGVGDDTDNCPETPNPEQTDSDNDGTGDACDPCPNDPAKVEPGDCGCGVPDSDSDVDGTADCIDNCPSVPNPAQVDTDGDEFGDACDPCPNQPGKVAPGICGCSVPDIDTDNDGVFDCDDNCPNTANPAQENVDGDARGDACDPCPNDPAKVEPGDCGCGLAETDTDADGTADCIDNCPNNINPQQSDSDEDGLGDACDIEDCPSWPDINDDGIVNFGDFTLLADLWLGINCSIMNDFCLGADLDCDGAVTTLDLWILAENWLWEMYEDELKLLLHLNGEDGATSTTDSSGSAHSPIAFHGDAQLDAEFHKWGTSALLLDGYKDYLSVNDSDDWDLCASALDDWTIDFFVRHSNHNGYECYVSQYENAQRFWEFYHGNTLGLRLYVVYDDGFIDTGWFASGEITDSDWHHVALVKNADIWGIYLDGTQVGYFQDNSTVTFAGSLYVGSKGAGATAHFFDGHIDEMRIIKSNSFGASPNAGLTDEIDIPTHEYLE